MTHQKMNFSDAVEHLAQHFQVPLEREEGQKEQIGPNKTLLKETLEEAGRFFHFCLLHTAEGQEALHYLYSRGIDLAFIRHFQLGWAPRRGGILRKALHTKKVSDEALVEAGLLRTAADGKLRDLFGDRILFPILSYTGEVIGFSGRKYREETFGGKYVNTPETSLFKKSRVLFGLPFSRKRIIKERQAIIVEGQIDALRLIYTGLNLAIAAQGTAFGEGHVQELLKLGVNQVFLALDGDIAGQEAAAKIGHFFQKEGVAVRMVSLPQGQDPDSFLLAEGPEAFIRLMEEEADYLDFLIRHLGRGLPLDSPAAKNELIQKAVKLIREWDHPVMVHETLRKLAHIMKVPEEMVGVGRELVPNLYIKRSASVGTQTIDPDRILETDLLRWLLLVGTEHPRLIELVQANLTKEDFHVTICQKIFEAYGHLHATQRPCDLLSLAIDLNDAEAQLALSDLVQKKVNKERAEPQLIETIQKLLNRNWMEKRETIKLRIQNGQCSEEEAFALVREFDELKRHPPRVKML